jgi:hypothetical protein
MKKILIALICLMPVAAFADSDKFTPDTFTPDKFTADKMTVDKTSSITLTDCQMLAEYKPSADTDYKPGVDANGKPVTPADLNPSPVKLPEKYSFDLNLNEASNLGITLPPGSQGLMKVGTVSIDKSGQVTFNGQPMEDSAVTALKAACAAKTAKNPPK